MAAPGEEQYLLRNRDDIEKNRLKFQHEVITKLQKGHLLDPLIPKESVHRIADVGAGTGAWLEDVSIELSRFGNNDLELFGFDISSAFWPSTPRSKLELVISDVNEGYPEEYHASFDVVHARLLILGLKQDQIQNAVENMVKLIKPGGYLQWTEYDFQGKTAYPNCPDTDLVNFADKAIEIFKGLNISTRIFEDVRNFIKKLPMEDVRLTDYIGRSYNDTEIRYLVTEWSKQSLEVFLRQVFKINGVKPTEEELAAEARKYKDKIGNLAKGGYIFEMPVATLTARKIV